VLERFHILSAHARELKTHSKRFEEGGKDI
jgi:hypothetical protein